MPAQKSKKPALPAAKNAGFRKGCHAIVAGQCRAQHQHGGGSTGGFAEPHVEIEQRLRKLDRHTMRHREKCDLRARILDRLLVGNGHPLVPLRGRGLEALDHLERVAVAGLFGLALIAGMNGRREHKDGRQADCQSQHHAHPCGINPRRLAMILSRVRLGSTAAIHRCIGSGTIV